MIKGKIAGIIVFIMMLSGMAAWSQSGSIPIKTWRVHLPNNSGQIVAVAGEKVYCATQLGLFYLDMDDNSVNVLSKVDGLSDIGITAMGYHSPTGNLLIGYSSGRIDLITGENGIINIPDMYLSSIVSSSKQINDITFNGNIAYLSTNFGVVQYDMLNLRFGDSYINIGPNGSIIQVNQCLFVQDSLFIATSLGVRAGNYINYNLLDFNNWSKISLKKDTVVQCLASYNGKLYAGISNRGLYVHDTVGWRNVLSRSEVLHNIVVKSNGLVVSFNSDILFYNPSANTQSSLKVNPVSNPNYVAYDASGQLWVADQSAGLVRITGQQGINYIPNGPASNLVFKLYAYLDKVLVLTGGYDPTDFSPIGNNKGFYIFDNGEWVNYLPGINYPNMLDMVNAAYNSVNGHLYISSQGYGILDWDLTSAPPAFNQITDKNPPQSTLIGVGNHLPVPYVRIPSVACDTNGTLWIGVQNNIPYGLWAGINSMTLTAQFTAYFMPGFVGSDSGAMGSLDIVVDNYGSKWIRNADQAGYGSGIGGITVFNENYPKAVLLTSGAGVGNLSNAQVNAIAKDLNGDIWVGTPQGVNVYYNTAGIFTSMASQTASQPVYQNRPLLYDQSITCIAVDGANRKWIGTNQGVYLFNTDGSQQLYYFTAENSPLLSDNINSIAINGATGEVFFGTDQGVVSYRETASSGTNNTPDPASVRIFPNPVTPNYAGYIGILGVSNNATVKITDINGRLVYQATANGGMVSWNGRDYNGRKVSTGVYIILSASSSGDYGYVGKILIMD